jgi:hypothetical protein
MSILFVYYVVSLFAAILPCLDRGGRKVVIS